MPTITHDRTASIAEIAAEMDRRGHVIVSLEAQLADAYDLHRDMRRLLVRCHDRIHCLPRTTDTELAEQIEKMLKRISPSPLPAGAPR